MSNSSNAMIAQTELVSSGKKKVGLNIYVHDAPKAKPAALSKNQTGQKAILSAVITPDGICKLTGLRRVDTSIAKKLLVLASITEW